MSGLLAIDPGKRSGWALYDLGVYKDSGVVDGTSLLCVRNIISHTMPEIVLVEDQFIGVSPKASMRIIEIRCRWENVAVMCADSKIDSVNNRHWQAAYTMKAGDKKAMAKFAKKIAKRDVEPDEADAILIGQWYCAKGLKHGDRCATLLRGRRIRRVGLRVDG